MVAHAQYGSDNCEKTADGKDKVYEPKRRRVLQLFWKQAALMDAGETPTMYYAVCHTFENKWGRFSKAC